MQLAQPQQRTAPASATQSAQSMLSRVTRGRISKPYRVVLYGPEGCGKSTFGSNAPNVVFLGSEDGTSELDVSRLPEPKNWEDATDAIEELRTAKHDYRSLVVDTLDWLEPLCWDKVCRDGKKKDIEDFGYGRGYLSALDSWRTFLHRLSELRDARSMHIILLAHSQIRTFRNPEGEDFDRYEMKLHAKTAGLVREWCDAMLFANYETLAYESKGRVRGIGTGARFMHTERHPAYDAKNRQGLPERLPLSWDDFMAAAKAGAPSAEAALRKEIAQLLEQVDAETREKALPLLADSDARRLAQIADRLRAKVDTSNVNNSQETSP